MAGCLWVRVSMVAVLATGVARKLAGAQTSDDQGGYDRAVTTLSGAGRLAGLVATWCGQRVPQLKEAADQAFETWRVEQGLPDVEARLGALDPKLRISLDEGVEASKPALYEKLEAGPPASVLCRDLGGFLAKNLDLRTQNVALYRTIAANHAPTIPVTRVPVAGGGTLYTPAQLTALAEGAREAARKDAEADAGNQALAALGLVYVTGVPDNSNILGYETVRGKSKASVSCLFLGDDDFEELGLLGKPVVIRGRARSLRRSFLDFIDCEVVAGASGLTASTIGEDPGLILGPGAMTAGVNRGIAAGDIDGVYLERNTGFGVGGMVVIRFDPVLLLKDGWAYDGWTVTPADLDVALSRKNEPKAWRRYERRGDQIRIQNSKGVWSDFERWNRVLPASPGDRIVGKFTHLGGGGNIATGGSTMIAAFSAYTFARDGTFTSESAVGASGGNEATDPRGPPGVVTTSQRSSQGSYVLDGYTLELRYGNGRIIRRAFLWFDDKEKDSIFIDGTAYLLAK